MQYESHYYDDIEGMEEELLGGTRAKPKTGRPVRSIMYYMKVGVMMVMVDTEHVVYCQAYEGSVSLTPVQLPPRSRIQQVAGLLSTYTNKHCYPVLTSANYC